jgi:hypothetical protein
MCLWEISGQLPLELVSSKVQECASAKRSEVAGISRLELSKHQSTDDEIILFNFDQIFTAPTIVYGRQVE